MSSLTNLASIGCVRWLIYTKTTNHATQKKFDKVGSSASNHSQTFGIFHLNAETFGEQLLYKRLNLSHSQKDKRATILSWSEAEADVALAEKWKIFSLNTRYFDANASLSKKWTEDNILCQTHFLRLP